MTLGKRVPLLDLLPELDLGFDAAVIGIGLWGFP